MLCDWLRTSLAALLGWDSRELTADGAGRGTGRMARSRAPTLVRRALRPPALGAALFLVAVLVIELQAISGTPAHATASSDVALVQPGGAAQAVASTVASVERHIGHNMNTAGHARTSAVAPNVTAAAPATAGQWSPVFAWPLVAVQMSLLPTGKVLTWEERSDSGAYVFDPASNTMTAAGFNGSNLFCSGTALLPDGRVFVAGGHGNNHVGIADATIFNAVTQSWSSGAPMSVARWYPTVTSLPDGRMLVTAGEINCDGCNSLIPEIYDPATNSWTQLTGASQLLPYYPHMFVLPDGRVLAASSNRSAIASVALNPSTQSWSAVDSGVVRDGGSAATYAPGKIIKSGLGYDPDATPAPSVATTYLIDMNQPAPAWRQTPSMAFPRTEHNLTLLPDGSVLATGGSRNSDVGDTAAAVLEPEVWSPTTQTWTKLAAKHTPRMYHSTALLLPDGRVLVAGGGRDAPQEVDQLSAEIYSPPYLFNGSRPTITSAPSAINYGTGFFVATPDAGRVASASLVRLGSVTHAFNMNQRFVPLTLQPAAGGLTIQPPGNANIAPPGDYMLFIVDTNGVPSVAPIVRLSGTPPPDTQPPSVPAGLSATGASPSQINLAWTASNDNIAVKNYLVERCPGAGCTTGFTQIATPTATTYSDSTGLSAGATYGYHVRATDAAGNLGGFSSTAYGTTLAAASGLLAAYAFNEGTGTTTADAAGKRHTGTLNGATWTTSGRYGKALPFNGSNGYLDPGNAADLQITGSMTVSAWIYATANPAADGQIVAKSDGSGWQLKTSPDTGPHTFGMAISPSNTQRYSKTVRQLNTWYHVAGVYDAAARTLNIYVNGVLDNGVLVGTVPASQANAANERVTVGRRTGGFYFQGSIDEVRLYGRALSQAEIQSDMNTGIATVPDTQPPSVPAGLSATGASASQINLSWTASNDNIAVKNYLVGRDAHTGGTNWLTQIATPTATTYSDSTGLSAGATYGYHVRATDAAGNLGGFSSTAYGTTLAAASGLLAAYAFNEGTGTTTADASGKGHTGTLNGATWTTSGRYGQALSFNGSTGYLDLGNAADLQITGSMTVSAWIYATANPAADGQIVAKSDGSGWQLKTSPDTGPHTFGMAISPSNTQRYSKTVRQLNTWYHVAGVYDAAARTLNIYVNGVLDNGVLVGTVPASQANAANERVTVGRRTGGFYFQGTIDEVRLYGRALSQAEIQSDMNTGIAGP